MELKYMLPAPSLAAVSLTFNRTIMELKQTGNEAGVLFEMAFNRTIMELKLKLNKMKRKYLITFNRTIMELKLLQLFHL